jgi:uncharacterized protein YecE (DUF72 family)
MLEMADQLGLFGDDGARRPRDAPAARAWPAPGSALEQRYERFRVLAASLPPGLRMGTSSWSFPGWQGIVYARRRSAAVLSKDGLLEYVQHPLLSTVGIDRSYYAPIPAADLAHYAASLTPGFLCCAKAPAAVTSQTLRDRGRHLPNPDFLSVERFERDLLEPLATSFAGHAGPVLLQFAPTTHKRAADAQAFVERLDAFLERLPRAFSYAVELRDRWVLADSYRAVLARHGAAHVYNYWSAMPMPGAQARVVRPEDQPFVMIRLLLRPGTWYEEQRQVFAPFDRLVEPDDEMRRDVIDLIRRSVNAGRGVFLLVNNKAEGSSPLTIEALAERLVAERPGF